MRIALIAICALFTFVANAGAETNRPFNPVGLWRFHHTDGTPFLGRLMPDQTATTNWEGGERGIWRWEGDEVRMIYTDGWDDVLHFEGGKMRKRGFAPEANRCGPPSNDTPAEKLSSNPTAKP